MSKTSKIISTVIVLIVFFFLAGIVSYYDLGIILLIMAISLVLILRGIWKKDKQSTELDKTTK